MTKPSGKPAVGYSVGVVAQWLGVGKAAVSNWLTRHPTEIPQPDVIIVLPSGEEELGWTMARREEWIEWFQARHLGEPRRRYRYRDATME